MKKSFLNSTSNFGMKNSGFCNISHEFSQFTYPEPGQKTSAPAPAKYCRSTGSGSVALIAMVIKADKHGHGKGHIINE
jgi:hypothetical protein